MLRVKGATIIEAIIAMTITVMIFGASMTLFMNAGRDYNQPLKARALAIVGNEVEKIRLTGEYSEISITADNVRIESTIEKFNEGEEILFVNIWARRNDNGKLLAERRLLFLVNEIKIVEGNGYNP